MLEVEISHVKHCEVDFDFGHRQKEQFMLTKKEQFMFTKKDQFMFTKKEYKLEKLRYTGGQLFVGNKKMHMYD